jgi:hypothetical protein
LSSRKFLGFPFPARPSSLGSDLGAFGLGHGLEPTLPANLTTFAAYGSHVFGQVYGRSGVFGDDNFLDWFSGRTIYNPLGKLVWVAWTLSFADCHDFLL